MGRGLAVLLTSTILLSGCTDSGKTEVETTQEVCNHLIIDFGDQTVIFKECEGYEIYCKGPKNGGIAKYTIGDNGDNILISGYTTEFNYYTASHNQVDEIEEKAIDDGAYVYKSQK